MRLMASASRPRSFAASGDRWRLTAGRVALMAALAAVSLTLAQPAAASTVLRRSLSDLVKSAELVFEGTVTASTVVPGVGNGPPRTCVTFDVTDVIAGQSPGSNLQLCFMGGEVDGVQTVVTDMHYPVVGEHGIYLAESTRLAMVNPLAGWDQGRFLVEKDPVSGAEKILTARRRPIVGLAEEARLPTAAMTILPGEGTAAGVMSGDGRDAFKTWLRSAR
jgi:hypothetical protein